jgi:catechol 2,3-dioxygenase-like lactoylglutathione lyase family enzyme
MLQYDGGLTCSLNVTDLDASLRWYQETLGFKLLYRSEELGWAELASSVARVNVGLSQVESVTKGGGATLTFGVHDVDKARRELEARKVRFDGATTTYEGFARLATFFDPDDNALMLYQDLAPKG